MKKVAHLIDDRGFVIAIFEIDKMLENAISGEVRSVQSWDMDGTPFETNYFAAVSLKWDGCSHFWLYGEDYKKGVEEEKDAYYHLCGVNSYVEHMLTVAFIYKVMTEQIPGFDKYMKEFEMKRQNKLFSYLDDCKIVYHVVDEQLQIKLD